MDKVYLKDNMDLVLQLAKDKYEKRVIDNDIGFPFAYVEKALKEYQDMNYNIKTGEVKKGGSFISGYSSPTDIHLEICIEDIIMYDFYL